MTFRAHCNDLAARRLELWFKSKIRLFFYEFWLAFCKVYNEISFEANGFCFFRQKICLSFTVQIRVINWFDLKLFWAFKFFRRLGGRCAGHLSPTSTDTVTHTYTHHAPQFFVVSMYFSFFKPLNACTFFWVYSKLFPKFTMFCSLPTLSKMFKNKIHGLLFKKEEANDVYEHFHVWILFPKEDK